jgi:hypothetical protein
MRQGTFREHLGNVQGTFREHSGNIQGTLREHTRNTQGMPRNIQGNIQHSRLSLLPEERKIYISDVRGCFVNMHKRLRVEGTLISATTKEQVFVTGNKAA